MREVLVERGFEKLCRELDDKINAEKGEAAARPLTLASVEQYLQVGVLDYAKRGEEVI